MPRPTSTKWGQSAKRRATEAALSAPTLPVFVWPRHVDRPQSTILATSPRPMLVAPPISSTIFAATGVPLDSRDEGAQAAVLWPLPCAALSGAGPWGVTEPGARAAKRWRSGAAGASGGAQVAGLLQRC